MEVWIRESSVNAAIFSKGSWISYFTWWLCGRLLKQDFTFTFVSFMAAAKCANKNSKKSAGQPKL